MSAIANGEMIHDIAHIGHAELRTPKMEKSLWFFTQVMGMEEEARQGQSVFLRGHGDYQRYGLKLTEAKDAGVEHLAFRAWSAAALKRRVEAIERSGRGIGWIDGDFGHGPAYQFTDPDGHRMEIYFETELYKAPAGMAAAAKNHPQRFTGRGAAIRRLDHINLYALDIQAVRKFAHEALGYRLLDLVVDEKGGEALTFLSVSMMPLELVYAKDVPQSPGGRLHHLAFWVDTPEEVLRAADIFLDQRIQIEVPPAKHTIGSSFFLYGREPGGNRIEVTTGVDMVYDPAFQPRIWTAEERKGVIGWGTKYPESWHTYGTPDLGNSK